MVADNHLPLQPVTEKSGNYITKLAGQFDQCWKKKKENYGKSK